MSHRAFNFSPGPAMLPNEVMEQAMQEFMDWNGTGMSVMEIGHRTNAFIDIAKHAEQSLRSLVSIPDNYHVLFLAGGATLQFSVAPMNLLRGRKSAGYIDTGIWSGKAQKIAEPYTEVKTICSSQATGYLSIPARESWKLDDEMAYCFYTENETVGGVEFQSVPEVEMPLVCDMTSSILSRPIDVSKYGAIIAGVQKNIAPAGMTIVIVDKSLCEEVLPGTPDLLNYQLQAEHDCMLNTPPTFNWYMAGLMFDWIKNEGGLEVMAERNLRKSEGLYQLIDSSGFYSNEVDRSCRSRMNVVFYLPNEELTSMFVKESEEVGLFALKGHKAAGGIRASLYNAMPPAGIDSLVSFMTKFERRHG